MINPEEDGLSHINVYSKGNTRVGRFYSNFYPTEIDIPGIGKFQSVEAVWYWSVTGGKSRKDVSGPFAKIEGKKHERVQEVDQDLIKLAIDIKMRNNRSLLCTIDFFDLPLKHYYNYGGKVVDAGYEWIIDHIELRRKQLKTWNSTRRYGK